jgi:carbamoyltransferase
LYILGINAYHAGASACLIHNGNLIAAAEEERFRRQKYWAGFPTQAIRWVLQEAGIQAQDLDHIGISRNPNAHLLQAAWFALRRRPSLKLIQERLSNKLRVGSLKQEFCQHIGVQASDLRATFHNVEHHRAHMASAFHVSPYSDAAVISVDGAGDFVTTMWGTGRDNALHVDDLIYFPHSLGIFYNALTQWLGFPKYGDEGKTMGLAPYGEPLHLDEMRKIVRVQADGTFELDLDYFVHQAEGAQMTWGDGSPTVGRLYSDKLLSLLGAAREPGTQITQKVMDVAASMQAMLEEAELRLIQKVQQATGKKTLCLAGGVALNSAFNGKILPNTDFEDIFIQPASGDAGTSLGVCYYIYHDLLKQPRCYTMTHAYTGPQWSPDDMRQALDAYSLAYDEVDDETLYQRAAERIAAGDVLGWFQGRSEWGPRALGNRSILADPRRKDMKDILNARIKQREPFRPFAPSVLLEDVGAYFEQSYPDPFMLKVYGILPAAQTAIPAVTHVDGTGRLQTVSAENAPRYHALISAFKQQTDVGVVLNTSFNENEPIVNTPHEAVDCFVRTRMDALAMGNFVVSKT